MTTVRGGRSPIYQSGLSCTATENVGDPVYFSGSDAVRQASAASIATALVCGFIESKQSDVLCTIKTSGFIAKSGLTAGEQYFLDITNGLISENLPTGTGTIIMALGLAQSSNELLINISQTPVIRS